MTKQTARNNAFLKAAKKVYNAPTYAKVLEHMNGPLGEQGCVNYLRNAGLATDPIKFLKDRADRAYVGPRPEAAQAAPVPSARTITPRTAPITITAKELQDAAAQDAAAQDAPEPAAPGCCVFHGKGGKRTMACGGDAPAGVFSLEPDPVPQVFEPLVPMLRWLDNLPEIGSAFRDRTAGKECELIDRRNNLLEQARSVEETIRNLRTFAVREARSLWAGNEIEEAKARANM